MKKKLLKTLLPIASSVAMVAPMITLASCSSKIDKTFELITDGEAKEFFPTISDEELPTGELTNAEATKLFFKAVRKNAEIFADDYIYGLGNNYIMAQGYAEYGLYSKWKMQVNVSNVKARAQRMSVKIIEDHDILQEFAPTYPVGTYHFVTEITDLNFYCWYTGSWSVNPNITNLDGKGGLRTYKSWKIHYEFTYTGSGSLENINDTLTYYEAIEMELLELQQKLSKYTSRAAGFSYYLSKIVPKPEPEPGK